MRLPGVEATRPRRSICSSSGLGNPGREYERPPSQRRLEGRRRARPAARRLVPEGKFSGRIAEVRLDEPSARAAQARDVHERLGPLGAAATRFYKLEPDALARRPRRVRPRVRSPTGPPRRRPRRPQRPALDRGALGTPEFLRLRVGVGRPRRGDRRPSADYVLSNFAPTTTPKSLVERPPTPSRRSSPTARGRRRASTERLDSAAARRVFRPPPWTAHSPPVRRGARGHERLPRVRRGAARRARVSEARAAARPRGPARGARAAARRARSRRRRRARRRRGRGWFLGADRVALLPSRGVRWGSGLEPPPHLVGERARALDVLAAGGLVCASAAALAEPCAAGRRAARRRCGSRSATSRASSDLTEQLALAGYERVDRADERGQFAVRGGHRRRLPDDRPRAAPRRALRRRDRADPRVLAVHAARAAPGRAGRRLPGRRAPARPRRAAGTRDDGEGRAGSRTTSCRRRPRARLRLGAGRGGASGRRRASSRSRSHGRAELDPLPAEPAVRVRGAAARARRARPRRGRERARRVRPRGPPRRRRLPAPRRGAARSRALLRKVEARIARRGRVLPRRPSCCSRSRRPARLRLARARARPAPRHAGLPQTRRRADARPRARAAVVRRPAHRRLRRPRGPRRRASCSASRRRRSPASRATTSSSRSAATTASTSRTSSSARSRATSAPTRRRPPSRSSAARPGRTCKSRAARVRARARRRAARALRAAPAGARVSRTTSRTSGSSGSRRRSPTARPTISARAIEAVKEDLEAARPMDRLVCGDVGFGKTEVAIRAAFAVAVNGRQVLVLAPTTILAEQHWHTFRDALPRLPGARRDGLALPPAERGQAGARRLQGGQGRRADRHAPAALPRRDPEGPRAS